MTPGPWFIDTGRPRQTWIVAPIAGAGVADPKYKEIARVTDMADARAIAALPELLECLRVLVRADELTAWDVGAWEEQARQIIAKIEGRS